MLLVVLALGFGACSIDNTYLPGLLADPMADFDPTGTELVKSIEQAEGTSFSGKPVHAKVTRHFRILDQGEAEAALANIVTYAESVGWDLTEREQTLYEGSKELDAGAGRVSVWLHAEDPLNEPDGPRALSFILDYGRVPD